MNEFIDLTYVLSFAGMVGTTVLLTQFFKKLAAKIAGKWVALITAVILCAVAAVFFGQFDTARLAVESILVWAINAILVWFAAMKAYETAQKDPSA